VVVLEPALPFGVRGEGNPRKVVAAGHIRRLTGDRRRGPPA
jgi:hypothetical protein